MLKIILFTLISLSLYSKDIAPSFFMEASGNVTDFVVSDEKLFVATSSSSIDIFDLNSKKQIESIKIPKIKDFTGDTIDSKIYSIDVLNNKILILSQGESGGRDIFIYEDKELKNIVNSNKRLFIANAKFIDDNNIIYALLSNQIFLFDIKNQKILKEIQVSQSSFSHFKLSSDKSSFLVADESGIISQIDTKTFQKIKSFKGQNVDRVFQVDFVKNTVLGVGQDRRASIYYTNGQTPYYKSLDFLIYAGALSPDAKLACISYDEDNNALVFDINSKDDLSILTQNKAILTKILFLDSNKIIISSDDKRVNFYNLKIKE